MPRLVLRFAVGSLVAFLAVGAGVGTVLARDTRARAERLAAFHARFVTDAVLDPALSRVDLSEPLTGAPLEALDAFVRARVLSDGRDVRVKIWRPDGTVVYSDARQLIGRAFPGERSELEEVLAGRVQSGVTDLRDPENVFERGLADKLFFTYAPLRVQPGGPAIAVAEIYQDYSVIQGDIDPVLRTLSITFGAGLLLLYAALLPISFRASRELRRQNMRLNELLAREQRTVAELTDLNQKKDDFVAAASHELRTPLTSIIGYLSTMKRAELQDDAALKGEFVDAAEGQAKRLLRLITNLLSAAHLEEGSRPIVMERIDFARLARRVAEELPGGPARVRLAIPAEAAFVVTDRGRLEDVLRNLLDNALKYSPDGSPVEAGASAARGAYRFWVRDQGVGIEPSQHRAVFDRFHQTDQSSTRRFGGVGLGLHLAKGLAEELGGTIELASAAGEGSTFTVTIPVARPREHERPGTTFPEAIGRARLA